jgi:hypothetical protein
VRDDRRDAPHRATSTASSADAVDAPRWQGAVIQRNTPSDPRLRERRGDLTGRSALIFAVAVLAVFGAVVLLLPAILPPRSAGPGASASASPTGATAASASPSAPAPPSGSAAPSRPPAPSAAVAVAGQPAQLVLEARPAGTVTVSVPRDRRRVQRQQPPDGRRWVTIEVRYQATAAVPFSPAHWSLVDAGGGRHVPADVAPRPPLGDGQLEAGGSAAGSVAFAVPEGAQLRAVVLSIADRDVLSFRIP